jgi:hypothetical protein
MCMVWRDYIRLPQTGQKISSAQSQGVFHVKDLGTFQYFSHNKARSSINHTSARLWQKRIRAFLLKLRPKRFFSTFLTTVRLRANATYWTPPIPLWLTCQHFQPARKWSHCTYIFLLLTLPWHYSWTSRPLKMKAVCCFKMSGTDYKWHGPTPRIMESSHNLPYAVLP